jgi:hypothetical protein
MAALSPAAPALVIEHYVELMTARATYMALVDMDQLAKEGRHAEVLHLLGGLALAASKILPELEQVIAAEAEAAQARHLTQRTLAPFFGPKTAEHADTAQNDNHPPSPQQPGPDVA